MNLTLRPFQPADYPQLARLRTALNPSEPADPAEIRFFDENRAAHLLFRRLIAEVDGEIVGSATYGQDEDFYHPRKFWLRLNVLTGCWAQGIEDALFDTVMTDVKAHDALSLLVTLSSSERQKISFIESQGFERKMRHWLLELPLADFNTALLDGYLHPLERHNIKIRSYLELAADPQRDTKLLELRNTLDQQVPFAQDITPVSPAWFQAYLLHNPQLLKDGFFVASRGETYIGMSTLYSGPSGKTLSTGLTGVLIKYRRKGVAKALKLKTVAYGLEHHYSSIRTYNSSSNRGMLILNYKLGFHKCGEMLQYVREIREG